MSRSQRVRQAQVGTSKRKLLFVSHLRIIDAWISSMVAIGLVAVTCSNTAVVVIALGLALAFAIVSDASVRAGKNTMLGPSPSNTSPTVIRRAITEAAQPVGITPGDLFPRHLSDRAREFGSAFAAGALVTQKGIIIFIGDALLERSRDAVHPSRSNAERQFAYDEVRAVLGHELAHVIPGTHASSRLLAVPHRFSTAMTWVAFWTFAVMHRPLVGLAMGLVAAAWHSIGSRKHRLTGPMRAFESITAIVATAVLGLPVPLLVVYLLWPLIRPLTAMAIQRRIEHACDHVAVATGADPSAMARFLQKFEPEHLRYRQMPLWQRLNASHPVLHRRIVDLDHF